MQKVFDQKEEEICRKFKPLLLSPLDLINLRNPELEHALSNESKMNIEEEKENESNRKSNNNGKRHSTDRGWQFVMKTLIKQQKSKGETTDVKVTYLS